MRHLGLEPSTIKARTSASSPTDGRTFDCCCRSFLFLGQAKAVGRALGAQTDRPAFSVAASGAAGAAAAWLTTPLDVVKTRLQVRGANPEAFAYAGPVDCVRSIVKREGAQSLFAGASGRIVYATLGMAVFLPLYDALSRLHAHHRDRSV